ncbi:MAG: Brp/Blh family beta-carotene 15,15'-dioxygenase [Planctomycetota bacterium]|nr:Brp/Blh family beta-carotene 15,15'-dioxygenase [Planctomycetota bacterium]
MILASIYIAICTASIGSVFMLGAPDWRVLALLAAISVAVVGVPHGGLDHWAGRRLLSRRFSDRWWLVFFISYLSVAVGFAASWIAFPVLTVLVFFIASAWHFGREDHKANLNVGSGRQQIKIMQKVFGHVQCMAVGGLVIWVPALMRPDEMLWLLRSIIPASGSGGDAQEVVLWTQWLSLILVPIAAFVITINVLSDPNELKQWVPVATVAISVFTPILLSFTIFFCAWHSIQGLRRLQRRERLTNIQFAWATFPMSAMAVAGIVFIGWFFQDATSAFAVGEQSPVLQTLFIGLSAIAVPHLLLHEMEDGASYLRSDGIRQSANSYADTLRLQKGTAS